MGRPDGDEMKSIKQKLLHLQEFLLLKPDLFQLFNSSAYGSKDLLLKDSTVRLIDVKEKNSTEAWLGEKYFKALKTLRSCQTVAAATRSFGEKLKTWKVGQLLCFYLVLFFSLSSMCLVQWNCGSPHRFLEQDLKYSTNGHSLMKIGGTGIG